MDFLRHDLRHAARAIVRRPLFAVVAGASLAIGIGATTALFGVVDVLALRPLPGIEGWDRAVELGRGSRGRGFDTFSIPDLADIAESVPALDRTVAVRTASFSLATDEGGVRLVGQYVSSGYFEALGVGPQRGRLFDGGETEGFGRHPVAVVSDRFWRTRLGGDPDAVGRTIRVNRTPLTVIGVTHRGFGGHVVALSMDLWVPLTMAPALHEIDEETFAARGANSVQAIGRLAPGATVDEANAQVSALFRRLAEVHPDTNRDRTARVISLGPVPGAGRGPVLAFLGALGALVLLVLVVTCANVGGMFLARAAAREKEIGIRLALGSGRLRLVRLLMAEILVVFLLGGLGGVAVAHQVMGWADLGALPIPVELSADLRPDPGVLALGLVVTVVTGLVFGLAPALQALRTDLLSSLKVDGPAGRGRGARLRSVFAAGQVGLSLVLLVSAGLFLRALERAGAVATGFEPAGVYATTLDLDLDGYGPGSGQARDGLAFQRALRERLVALPGVASAALGIDLPLDMASHGTGILPAGWPETDVVGVDFNHVSPGWFETLGIPVRSGRGFDERDGPDGEPVAVVSRTLAERVWPGEEPVGQRFRYLASGRDGPTVTVVGVADDIKNQSLMDEAKPFVYRPLAQAYRPDVVVAVRTRGPAGGAPPALRAALLELDPTLSLTPVVSVEDASSVGILPQRIAAGVAGGLGLVALLLAGLGVYGVVAHGVIRRTREIGIRMALGAGSRRILADVLRRGVGLAAPGLAVGALLAAPLAYALSSANFLLGLEALDPVSFGGVSLLLLTVVLVASAVPARRAARIPPAQALRRE